MKKLNMNNLTGYLWIIVLVLSASVGVWLFWGTISKNSISGSSDTAFAIAIAALVITVIIFLIQAYLSFLDLNNEESSRETLIMNLGIFGTFLGIIIGLATFDVSNINESIKVLLEGMKTAFFTSAVGLAFNSIILLRNILQTKEEEMPASSSSLSLEELQKNHINNSLIFQESIIKALSGDSETSLSTQIQKLRVSFTDEIKDMKKDITQALIGEGDSSLLSSQNKLVSALVGDEDSTLLTQLQKLRTSLDDGLKDIKAGTTEFKTEAVKEIKTMQDDLRDFAKQAAENNIKLVVEALKETMKDFNNNLTEQFGDNFKKLNEAVEKLLDWQENYKTHVEQTEKHLSTVLERFDSAQESLEQVSKNAESLLEASTSINTSTEILNKEHEEVLEKLQLLTSLRQNMEELPKALESVISKFDEIPTKIEQSQEMFLDKMGDTYEKTSDAMEEHQKNLMDSSKNTINEIKQAFVDSSKNLDDVTTKFEQEFASKMIKNNEATVEFIANVGKGLNGQLSKIMSDYGSNFIAITEKMVEVYGEQGNAALPKVYNKQGNAPHNNNNKR